MLMIQAGVCREYSLHLAAVRRFAYEPQVDTPCLVITPLIVLEGYGLCHLLYVYHFFFLYFT